MGPSETLREHLSDAGLQGFRIRLRGFKVGSQWQKISERRNRGFLSRKPTQRHQLRFCWLANSTKPCFTACRLCDKVGKVKRCSLINTPGLSSKLTTSPRQQLQGRGQ